MEKTQKSVVEYGKKIEKAPYLMHIGRLIFASAFIVLLGESSMDLTLMVDQAKYIVGLGIVMKAFGGILFIFNTSLGALLLTVSADDGVALSFYNSIVNEDSFNKFCDQLNEIARLAISNPLFTPSESNTLFMRFIKGVGIAAALVFFIAMKHRHDKMLKKPIKKHKIN